MAAKLLTTEAIALTEKKMDMSLDDIVKMSNRNDTKPKNQQISNRGQKFVDNAFQDNKSYKVQKFMDTRSSIRQGAFAQRRSNFAGNQFPLATKAARKAGVAPIRNKAFNQTRPFNQNLPRVGNQSFQKNATNGVGFNMKKPLQRVVNNNAAAVVLQQKPQTLDSLFGNMAKERMKRTVNSQQNNNNGGSRRINGGGQQQSRGVPWARNRFHN